MNNIVSIASYKKPTIDLDSLRTSAQRKVTGLIAPAEETVISETVVEHDAQPIKDPRDIDRISEYLIQNERYRDNMLFIVGINFGLRVSDLVKLRFSDIIDEHFAFRTTFGVWETKTRNTRKNRRNRYITINTAVMEAVTLYLEHTEGVTLSDYMFRSQSNNGASMNSPLNRKSVDRILKGINQDLGLGIRMSTHTLRKTFGYHQMLMSNNDPRKLLLLQKMFGHSSIATTLDYIGITDEEIEDAYRNLNLGSASAHYLVDSSIVESAAS